MFEKRDSRIVIVAPHGGLIEPGTAEITGLLAGTRFSFYTFLGLKKSGNRTLHISSNHFEEPEAERLIRSSEAVITIHGMKSGDTECVVIGGLHRGLNTFLEKQLRAGGFRVESPEQYPYLRGIMPENICNRGMSGAGSQIEISRRLRDTLLMDTSRRDAFRNAVLQAVELAGLL